MKISLPESKLRRHVKDSMEDHWSMTWHEDREITPGVPDLHYVMDAPGEDFRVGWLELKAIDTNISKSSKISVEPSQHQYFRRWVDKMPIHFLVRVQTRLFVISGAYHGELADANCLTDLKLLCLIDFEQSQIVEFLPPILRKLTRI